MFVRGAGTNSNNSYNNNVGPAVKAIQTDAIKTHVIPPHSHTITDPTHTHPYNDIYWSETGMGTTLPGGSYNQGAGSNQGTDYNNSGLQWERTTSSSSTGISINNSADGTTTYTGATETRPVNYGVNYIIKL